MTRTAATNQIIVAKTVGLLSAMGSAYILYKFIFDVKGAADRRKKLNRSFDRLLLGLCVSDFFSSIAIFLGSWSVPANPPIGYEDLCGLTYEELFPQAVGTTGTCTAQGFFFVGGYLASVMFTGCISLSFLF